MARMIPEEKIADIKNAVDIVDIVSEVVLLKKTGKNYQGLCPFHTEKTPSFTVSPDKQIFHCFGCGSGGNVFSFLMKHEGLSFPDAARALARRYGVDLPRPSMSQSQLRQLSEHEKLYKINQLAADYYHGQLCHATGGKKVREYLQARGITESSIEDFELGFALESWDGLLKYLATRKVGPGEVSRAGLAIQRKDGNGYYDRFRGRVIFPIRDLNGRVIAFGGRILGEGTPKYLNSPETPIYQKSKSLYGLNRAKKKCREAGSVFIAEGYLDLLSLHQYGIENAVAMLGTALTTYHVRMLKGFATEFILVFDSDAAGIKAAQRSIPLFWHEHIDFGRSDVFKPEAADTRILVLPEGHDPDTFLRQFGEQAFRKMAQGALGIIPFLIDCAIKQHGLSIEGKLHIIEDIKGPLASINDTVARSLYVQYVSEKLGITETAILEKVRAAAASGAFPGKQGVNAVARTEAMRASQEETSIGSQVGKKDRKYNRMEQRIVSMMLQFPEILVQIEMQSVIDRFEDSSLKLIAREVLNCEAESVQLPKEVMNRIGDDEKKALASALAIGDEPWDQKGCLSLIAQFKNSVHRRGDPLLEKIKNAEEADNHDILMKLLKDKQDQAERFRGKQRAYPKNRIQ